MVFTRQDPKEASERFIPTPILLMPTPLAYEGHRVAELLFFALVGHFSLVILNILLLLMLVLIKSYLILQTFISRS